MTIEVLDPAQYPREPGSYFKANSWAQQRFLDSTAPDLLYSGRVGSSKTHSVGEKMDERARDFPHSRIAIGRRYREHLGTTTLAVIREKVISPAHWDWGWAKSNDGGSTLFYPNGSSVLFVGFDNPQRLLSAEFDLIIIDQCEELNEEQWSNAAGRLRRNTYRIDDDGLMHKAHLQMAGACNPDSPEHFLFHKFRPDIVTPGRARQIFTPADMELPDGRVFPAGSLVAECVVAGATDNYANLPMEYIARLQRTSGRWYERMVLGKWVAFEGMVYDCFDRDIHVKPKPIGWREWGGYPPPTWERIRSFDFGFNPDPFVCGWFARSPSGTWFAYRTVYHSRRTAPQIASQVLAEEAKELLALQEAAIRHGHPIPETLPLIASYSDHDSGTRALLRDEGVATNRAEKDILAGIQTVYGLMQPIDLGGGVKQARLVIVDDSVVERDEERADAHLTCDGIQEAFSYKWPKANDDKSKPNKQVPIDANNHWWDMCRYAFHTLWVRQHWI